MNTIVKPQRIRLLQHHLLSDRTETQARPLADKSSARFYDL